MNFKTHIRISVFLIAPSFSSRRGLADSSLALCLYCLTHGYLLVCDKLLWKLAAWNTHVYDLTAAVRNLSAAHLGTVTGFIRCQLGLCSHLKAPLGRPLLPVLWLLSWCRGPPSLPCHVGLSTGLISSWQPFFSRAGAPGEEARVRKMRVTLFLLT